MSSDLNFERQGGAELAGYHSDHGCWPHEEGSSHSSLWGSQDGPDKDIVNVIAFTSERKNKTEALRM